MENKSNILSRKRLKRLRDQGYSNFTDQELSQMAFGIRFAYRACVSLVVIALMFPSLWLFSIILGIVIFGVILPNHPFDYIYNGILIKWRGGPHLPPRAVQLKFACGIATLFMLTVVYCYAQGYEQIALAVAGTLAAIGSLPGTIDLCIPSIIYKALFSKSMSHISTK